MKMTGEIREAQGDHRDAMMTMRWMGGGVEESLVHVHRNLRGNRGELIGVTMKTLLEILLTMIPGKLLSLCLYLIYRADSSISSLRRKRKAEDSPPDGGTRRRSSRRG